MEETDTWQWRPIPHVDLIEGIDPREWLANGFMYFVGLILVLGVLALLLRGIGAFSTGFMQGFRKTDTER